jgi:hypothetical protein
MYGICVWNFGSVVNVGSVAGMIVGGGCSTKTVGVRALVFSCVEKGCRLI